VLELDPGILGRETPVDATASAVAGRLPLRLVHLPVHASWLNQIEIYFSVIQRKVLTPNDFLDLAGVEQRLLAFQRRYEQAAVPFDWRYTRADLDWLLRRLDEKEQLARAA